MIANIFMIGASILIWAKILLSVVGITIIYYLLKALQNKLWKEVEV